MSCTVELSTGELSTGELSTGELSTEPGVVGGAGAAVYRDSAAPL